MAAELAEMGAIRAAQDPRLASYDKRFQRRKDCAVQCNDSLREAWLARVRRLPAPAEGAVLDRRFVNRLIVDVYLKRIDLVAKAGGSLRTSTRPTLCSDVLFHASV